MTSAHGKFNNRIDSINTIIVLPILEPSDISHGLIQAIYAILGDSDNIFLNSDIDSGISYAVKINDEQSVPDEQSVLIVFADLSDQADRRQRLESGANLLRTFLRDSNDFIRRRVEVITVVRVQEIINRLVVQKFHVIIWEKSLNLDDLMQILASSDDQTQERNSDSISKSSSLDADKRPQCLILSACFDGMAAFYRNQSISTIIRIAWSITNDLTIGFLTDFYRYLSHTVPKNYRTAFKAGSSAIDLLGLAYSEQPRIVERGGEFRAITKSGSFETELIALESFPRSRRTDSPEEIQEQRQGDDEYCKIWFGTNRNPINSDHSKASFGSEYVQQLHTGLCQVRIPKGLNLAKRYRSWITDTVRPSPEFSNFRILSNQEYQQEYQKYLTDIENSSDPCAIVYLHGFGVTFEGAAIRAAKIGTDLRGSDVMALFSWPSKGSITPQGYISDSDSARASAEYLIEYLRFLKESLKINQIHLVAYSMGHLCLHEALRKLYAENTSNDQLFKQLVIAASDLDMRTFNQYLNVYEKAATRTTRYVSRNDLVLKLSRYLHNRSDRVGLIDDYVSEKLPLFVDTIDVTPLQNIWLAGHGYFSRSREVMSDIYYSLLRTLPPYERYFLRQSIDGLENYWQFNRS